MSGNFYKDWEKVAINLNNYLYEHLRIEVLIADCGYHAHWGYAYIAGECRKMSIDVAGCPAGADTTVATLTAPRDMRSYRWYASEWGGHDPASDFELRPDEDGNLSYFTWREVTRDTTSNTYKVYPSDFRVRYAGTSAADRRTVDSIGAMQSFRCVMTSAIDPDKPFRSYLYATANNTKPSMSFKIQPYCTGGVNFTDNAIVPGLANAVDTNTQWAIYRTRSVVGRPYATVYGKETSNMFDTAGAYGLRVTSYYKADTSCNTTFDTVINVIKDPNTRFTLSADVLCDADETRLVDITEGIVRRKWYFLNGQPADTVANPISLATDSIIDNDGSRRIVERGFGNQTNPIILQNYNGQYYLNPENVRDTIWCTNTATKTVTVFKHPKLEVTGDTVVCEGSRTDAMVAAVGVDSCKYEWSRTMGENITPFATGQHLAVVPYADTSKYYVKVTSPQRCVAWDSVYAYLVRPKLTMTPADGRICPGQEATLVGSEAHHYTWRAAPEDRSLAGQESNDTIKVSPEETTTYTMIGHGSNNCDATPLTKTVTVVPLVEPRVEFSPGFIDSDNPEVTLRDVSRGSSRSTWLFNGTELVEGREITHKFEESLTSDSIFAVLTSYNELNCPIEYRFGMPVNLFTAWYPNVFTPGSEDENSLFRLYTINHYEEFHIRIYNRRGEMVFESEDPTFAWDGTDKNGNKLPQAAYVYICNYRKPGTTTLSTLTGTITLLR